MKKLLFLYMAATMFLLSSCLRDTLNISVTDPAVLQFTYTDVSWPQAKGADNNLDQTGQTISVFGYQTAGEWSTSFPTATPNLFDAQEVTRQPDGKWSYSPSKEWGDGSYHHFFAFSPHGVVAAASINRDTIPSFVYQVPVASADQKDLLWSIEPAAPTATQKLLNRTNGSGIIDFTFHHALTKISFAAKIGASLDNDRYKITSITLQDVLYEGRTKFIPKDNNYAAPDAYTGATWIRQSPDRRRDFTASEGDALQSDAWLTGESKSITASTGYLYMMPQKIEGTTAGNTPKILITIRDKNAQSDPEKVLTAPLGSPSGAGWLSGKHVEYSITYNGGGSDALTIQAAVSPWNSQDISASLNGTYLYVDKDYVEVTGGDTYRIYYSTDATSVSCQFNGNTYSATSIGQGLGYIEIPNILNPATAIITAGKLKRHVVLLMGVYDHAKDSESSNCYMLPVVTRGKTTFFLSPKRVDEYWNGEWIKRQITSSNMPVDVFCAAVSTTLAAHPDWVAEVLWADFDIASQIRVARSQNDKIEITLNSVINFGKGGNVIVCVRKAAGGEILWSWHVWITDAVTLSGSNINYTFTPFTSNNDRILMDRNLGARTNSQSFTTDSYGLFYQWGRKDPFPGSGAYATHIEPTIYTPSGSGLYGSGGSYGQKLSSRGTMAASINNPLNYYGAGEGDWVSSGDPSYQKMNRWLYLNVSSDTDYLRYQYPPGPKFGIKTIYDPCPKGYRLGWGIDWSGMPTTEYSRWSTNGINWLYNGKTTWMPAPGYRNKTGGDIVGSTVSSYGRYWSGSPAVSPMYAHFLDISKSFLDPKQFNARSFGYSVRCVKEIM